MKEAIQGIFESEFLSGAFLLSVFAGLILSLKSVGKVLYDRIKRKFVYTVRIEQLDELFLYMERWLKEHHDAQYRNVIAHLQDMRIPFYEDESSSDDQVEQENVKYRQENDTLFLRYKGVYLKVYKGREKLENANSLKNLYFDHFSISTLFHKLKILELIEDVVKFNQQFKKESNKRDIYTWDGYHNWNRLSDIKMKSFDQVILHDNQKELLKRDIEIFVKNEQWYTEKAIPYKRGYLFHGSPGNGKTSLSVAMAEYLNRSIHTITVSEISDDNSMRSVFSNVKSNSILLFEDVDTMFDSRKSKKDKLSFSTFLNCLDGVFYKHGLIVIMTTNRVEKLDPALVRAGRIDFKMEISNPEFDEVLSYMDLFYDKTFDLKKNGYANKYSMADIQGMCMQYNEDVIIKEIF